MNQNCLSVEVQYFAHLAQIIAPNCVEKLPEGDCLQDFSSHLCEKYPAAAKILKVAKFAVNEEIKEGEYVLKASDRVCVFPPFSGG